MPGENARIHKPQDKKTKLSHSHLRSQSTQVAHKENTPIDAPVPLNADEPIRLKAGDVLHLQGSLGNETITRLIGKRKPGRQIQSNLIARVTRAPGEQEADRINEVQINPSSDGGKPLMAHELTRVVQQGDQSGKPIQRWGIKALGGFGGLKGHEALTEVATENWEGKFKAKIKTLEKRKKKETGEAREKTEREIEALQGLLLTKDEKSGLVAGSRFNDMLHNATIIGLGMEIGKEGTLTHESHEGQLQFLHSMASKVAEQAWQTQHKIMMWAEFCYKVGTGNIRLGTKLKNVQIATEKDFTGGPTIAKLFEAWGDQTVGWLFTGKSKESSQDQAPNIAMGSMMHMLQDSFCMSHAQREVAKRHDRTARLIKGFNVYTEQHSSLIGGRHGKADVVKGHFWNSSAKRVEKTEGAEEAVEVSRKMIDFWQKHAPWDSVNTYLKSILGLSSELEAQRPTNGKWTEGTDETGGRSVSASGRLFRKTLLIDKFKSVFGKKIKNEPHEVFLVRAALEHYNALLATELKVLTEAFGAEKRAQLFLRPQDAAVVEAMKRIPAAISKIDGWTKEENKRQQYKGVLNEIEASLYEDSTEIKRDLSSLRDSTKVSNK